MRSKAILSSAAILALAATEEARAGFDPCRFNVGVDLKQASTKKCGYLGCTNDVGGLDIPSNPGPDFVAEYVGVNYASASQLLASGPSDGQEGLFLGWAKTLNATPLWYTYIIAGDMKFKLGLSATNSDCNQGGGKTICSEWGSYYSSHRADIISNYSSYADYAAKKYGSSTSMIWALEPDFYQYASNQNGNSSPLSFSDAAKLISDIIDAIKAKMPNAKIAMDISAWAPDNWFTSMPLDKIDYFHASGGTSQPGSQIQSANPLTWSHLHQLTGKSMIGDDGYGVGGGSTSLNQSWYQTSNVQSRLNDGVVGIMEAAPTSSMSSSITTLHGLSGATTCRVLPKYTVTATATAGGSVSLIPAATGNQYDSGTIVKVKATAASSSYVFAGWSGATTSTKDSVNLTVSSNISVTANFTRLVPKYSLSISQLGALGTIKATPAGSNYDSGTVVGLKATPKNGYVFQSWGGDASGTSTKDTTTITMNSNKTVSATYQTASVLDRNALGFSLVRHGDQITVGLDKAGSVQFSLVSLDGREVQDLGSVRMEGQQQTFRIGALSAGVRLLRMRGEGWQSVARLPPE